MPPSGRWECVTACVRGDSSDSDAESGGSEEAGGEQEAASSSAAARASPSATLRREALAEGPAAAAQQEAGEGSPRGPLLVPPDGGASPRARDAGLVRLHAEHVLRLHFPRAMVWFKYQMRVGIPLAVFVQLGLLLEIWRYADAECAQPVHAWGKAAAVAMFLHLIVNHPMARGSLAQRLLCRWERDIDRPAWVPTRVRVYDFLTMLLMMEINFMGLYYCVASDYTYSYAGPGGRLSVRLPPCGVSAPGLVSSSRFVACFNMFFLIIMSLNTVGLVRLLQLAMRQRILHTTDAAPEGALDRNTEDVTVVDISLEDHPSCSICLEDFDDDDGELPLAKTKACGHPFHRRCLEGWLQVSRTCPLCRYDLGNMDDERGLAAVPRRAPAPPGGFVALPAAPGPLPLGAAATEAALLALQPRSLPGPRGLRVPAGRT